MQTRKTHFEQIPIEVVKKIAQDLPETEWLSQKAPLEADEAVPSTPRREGSILKADYPWQELYHAAILETDTERMEPRIQAAKAALDARLLDLQLDHGGKPEERHAIGDALKGLTVLQKETKTWPHYRGLSKA